MKIYVFSNSSDDLPSKKEHRGARKMGWKATSSKKRGIELQAEFRQ